MIELLVVISIVALLIALLLPALGAARRTAMVTMCSSNLKNYALGMTVWSVDDEGLYPAAPYDHFWPSLAWSTSFQAYGLEKESYLSRFTEVVMGTNPLALWCPLDRIYLPIVEGDPDNWYIKQHGSGQDPDYPGYWWDPRFGYDVYWTGYIRLGGYVEKFRPSGTPKYDFTNSGNAFEGPPRGPEDGHGVILFDTITSEFMNWWGVHQGDPNAATLEGAKAQYRENNLAYTDGHVETHTHQVAERKDFFYIPYFPDGHYVLRSTYQHLLY